MNGTLAVARALGDFSFKAESKLKPEEQQVTCNPEIKKFDLEVRPRPRRCCPLSVVSQTQLQARGSADE